MESGAKHKLVLVVVVSKHQNQVLEHATSVDQVFENFKSAKCFEGVQVDKKQDIADTSDINACRFEITTTHDEDSLREELKAIYNANKLDQCSDFMLCSSIQYFTPKKLVVFDMDGTLLHNECIDEIAGEVGIMQEVSRITKMAMESNMDFGESLRQRVALLAGLDEHRLENVWKKLKLHQGVFRLMKALKRAGIKTAVVSGGFTYFTHRVGTLLDMDYAFSNTLEFANGKLTGKVIPPIVDGKIKEFVVGCLSEKEHFDIAETVAIGDGSNDKLMIQRSGFGVAFHAKAILKNSTKHHLNVCGMDSLGCYLNVDLTEYAKDDLEVAEHFMEWNKTKPFAPLQDFMKGNQ